MKKTNYNLLVIDDDVVDREMIWRLLSQSKKYIFHILNADNVKDGFNLFMTHSIDCVLLDYMLQGATGFDFINQLQRKFSDDLPPIIILTNQGNEEVAVSFLQSGALDYMRKEKVCKASLETAIVGSIKRYEQQNKRKTHTLKLDYLSSHDELTKLANRWELDRVLNRYIALFKRYHRFTALLFCDLDKFKRINDVFGHATGDLLLKQTAERLKKCLRNSDFIARVGGDEFVIILDEAGGGQEVTHVASRLCHAINQPFIIFDKVINITISIGVVCMPSDTDDPLELLNRADKAMYQAKISGENRYQFYT